MLEKLSPFVLDRGESEAIALALQLKADLVILDELRASGFYLSERLYQAVLRDNPPKQSDFEVDGKSIP